MNKPTKKHESSLATVTFDKRLSAGARVLYAVVWSSSKFGKYQAEQYSLAYKMGISVRHLRRHIAELTSHRYLSVNRGNSFIFPWFSAAKNRPLTAPYLLSEYHKQRARMAIRSAILSGDIDRPGCCSKCHIACKPEAHHENYLKYLDIEWLCRKCHREADRARRKREMINA